MRRYGLGGSAVLAVVLISGCSSGDTPPDAPPGEPITLARSAPQAALNETAGLDAQLQDARYRLYDKCMSAKGFPVHPRHEPSDPSHFTAKEPPPSRPANLADARGFGYQIATGPPAEPTDKTVAHDPFDDQPAEARSRYSDALTGPGRPNRGEQSHPGEKQREIYVMPDGKKQFVYKQGCQPEVDAAVLGDVKRYIELRYAVASGLDSAVYQAAYDDPEVAAARSAWIGCMSGKGYPGMRDPVDAAKKAESIYQNVDQRNPDAVRQAQQKEIAQAVAHVECAQQTKVDEKQNAAWHREFAEYLAAHDTDLVAWHESTKNALARAQQLLAG